MPNYEYYCKKCNKKSEIFESIKEHRDENIKKQCPLCKNDLQKCLPNFSILSKDENVGNVVKASIEEHKKMIQDELEQSKTRIFKDEP